MSRRAKRARGNPARAVSSTGLRVQARQKWNADIPDPAPGRHQWTVTGMWLVTDPTEEQLNLDLENLVTLVGPGCFVCEETYSAELAAKPCPGEPTRGWL